MDGEVRRRVQSGAQRKAFVFAVPEMWARLTGKLRCWGGGTRRRGINWWERGYQKKKSPPFVGQTPSRSSLVLLLQRCIRKRTGRASRWYTVLEGRPLHRAFLPHNHGSLVDGVRGRLWQFNSGQLEPFVFRIGPWHDVAIAMHLPLWTVFASARIFSAVFLPLPQHSYSSL